MQLSLESLELQLSQLSEPTAAAESVEDQIWAKAAASKVVLSQTGNMIATAEDLQLEFKEDPRRLTAAKHAASRSAPGTGAAARCTLRIGGTTHICYNHAVVMPIVEYLQALVHVFQPKGFFMGRKLAWLDQKALLCDSEQLRASLDSLNAIELYAAVCTLRAILARSSTPDRAVGHWLGQTHQSRMTSIANKMVSSPSIVAEQLHLLSPEQVELCFEYSKL